MTLSCFIRGISSSVLKRPVFESWNKLMLKPVCSICVVRQSYHHTLISSDKGKDKELSAARKIEWKSDLLLSSDVTKKFSTSSSLMSQHKSHDHSKLWTFERLLSVILLPLIPAALVYPSQSLDTASALIVVLHTHFGLEAIIVDYIRPILFGELAPKISLAVLYLLSIITLGGLLNLIYNDTGLANTLITIWKK